MSTVASWRRLVEFRVELTTGAWAGSGTGAVWDVNLWDTPAAVWAGGEKIWTDLYCDLVDAKIVRGRPAWGRHFTAGMATITLANPDGLYSPSQPPEVPVNLTAGREMRITATVADVTYPMFRGQVVSVVDAAIPGRPALTTVTLAEPFSYLARIDRLAGPATGAGETSGTRVGRMLDSIEWPSDRRSIDSGTHNLAATTHAANFLTELYLTADSEGGEIYTDRDGDVVFRDFTWWEWQGTLPAVFVVADDAAPDGWSGVPWICWAGYTPQHAVTRVVNEVSMARAGGAAYVTADLASRAAYGRRTVIRTDLTNDTDADVEAIADRVLTNGATLGERIVSVRLTNGDAAAAAAVLDLEFGAPIETNRHTGGYELTATAQIHKIEHRITPATWHVTLGTDDVLTGGAVNRALVADPEEAMVDA